MGMTLTSEPVSTRKRVCIVVSLTKNRRLGRGPLAPVAASVRLGSFPNCMAPCISELLHHIFTSRQNRRSHAVVQRGCDDCGVATCCTLEGKTVL